MNTCYVCGTEKNVGEYKTVSRMVVNLCTDHLMEMLGWSFENLADEAWRLEEIEILLTATRHIETGVTLSSLCNSRVEMMGRVFRQEREWLPGSREDWTGREGRS